MRLMLLQSMYNADALHWPMAVTAHFLGGKLVGKAQEAYVARSQT